MVGRGMLLSVIGAAMLLVASVFAEMNRSAADEAVNVERERYNSARGNYFALELYVDTCKVCEFKTAAVTEMKEIERKRLTEEEKQTYRAARGNIFALEMYIND